MDRSKADAFERPFEKEAKLKILLKKKIISEHKLKHVNLNIYILTSFAKID